MHTVDESGHLRRAAVSMCQWFPTFQRNVAGADPNKKRNFAFDPAVARADTLTHKSFRNGTPLTFCWILDRDRI